MPGARCARSRAWCVESTRVSHHGHTGKRPAFPARWCYSLFRALPGDRALLPPSPLRSLLLKNLAPASGRQDHAISPSASGAFVCRAIRVHRIPPHVRDDRERPPGEAGPNCSIPVSTRPSSQFLKFRNRIEGNLKGAPKRNIFASDGACYFERWTVRKSCASAVELRAASASYFSQCANRRIPSRSPGKSKPLYAPGYTTGPPCPGSQPNLAAQQKGCEVPSFGLL